MPDTPESFQNRYRIKSTRLEGWDYSSDGYYFVTICVKDRECFFGDVVNEKMVLNKMGKIAEKFWLEIPQHFPFVVLDEFVVMPNHLHGIVAIENNDFSVETQNFASLQSQGYKNKFGPQSNNLASIIRGFKIGVTKYANQNDILFQWQPRFYDHIIRNEESLNRIREYIIYNPLEWNEDRNNLENLYM